MGAGTILQVVKQKVVKSNQDNQISQDNAATEFRCGGRFYFTAFRSLSTNPEVKELLKSVYIC